MTFEVSFYRRNSQRQLCSSTDSSDPAWPVSSSTLLRLNIIIVTSQTATYCRLNTDLSDFASLDLLQRTKVVCCHFIKTKTMKT